jgi:hypothetical protein
MNYCPNCDAELTSADYEAGHCTQCGCPVHADPEEQQTRLIGEDGFFYYIQSGQL